MEVLLDELRRLSHEIENSLSLESDPDEIGHKLLHKICDAKPFYVALVNLTQVQPVFFCSKSKELLGIDNLKGFPGMTFYTRILSPENLPIIKDGLAHFIKTPTKPFAMTYRVRTATLGWRWVYGISIPCGNTTQGVKYTLTILRDVEESFEKLLSNTNGIQKTGLLSSFKARRLLQLSEREKDVLLLMADDLTTQQMSDKLHITTDTIQFHKKQLKRKLQANTSHGLVRYAIYLQEFMDTVNKVR